MHNRDIVRDSYFAHGLEAFAVVPAGSDAGAAFAAAACAFLSEILRKKSAMAPLACDPTTEWMTKTQIVNNLWPPIFWLKKKKLPQNEEIVTSILSWQQTPAKRNKYGGNLSTHDCESKLFK